MELKILAKEVSESCIGKAVRAGNFPRLEIELYRYMRDFIRYMKQQTMFREEIVRTKELEVNQKLLERTG